MAAMKRLVCRDLIKTAVAKILSGGGGGGGEWFLGGAGAVVDYC